jgi:hypothetical protein
MYHEDDEDAYPHRFEEDRFPSYYDQGGVWMQRRKSRVDDAYWVYGQCMVPLTANASTEVMIVEAVELMHESAEELREDGDEMWMDLIQWEAQPWLDTLFDIRNLKEHHA